METDHTAHHDSFLNSRLLTGLALGGIAIGAAVMLSPHILPALGIGSEVAAEDAMFALHSSMDAGGSGLAGVINTALSAVPVIGGKLAEGGLFNAAATATVGIGGVLLGQFIAKREDGSKRIKWGNVIKYAALITSAMIALPTVLTGISTGLIYLSTLAGDPHLTFSAISFVDKIIGAAGSMAETMMGFSGLGAVIPHFLTCGSALLPAALSIALGTDEKKPAPAYTDGSLDMAVALPEKLSRGVPAQALLKLSHKDGSPVTLDDLAVVHTKKLHLFVVDSSLTDYHHLHPEPTGTPGEYAFTFTPRTGNKYSAWADITMIADSKNHKLQAAFPSPGRQIPPSIKTNANAAASGLRFEWRCDDTLVAGKPVIVEATVRDANGNIVQDLEPVMGAFAHLVGFGADGKSIVHTHPLGREPESPADRGEGKLRFHVEPNFSGPTQFYLQVKRGGEDIFAPFGQQIAPKEKNAYAMSVSAHAGHAM